MKEGNRRITLRRPRETGNEDYVVWATRDDKLGTESFIGEGVAGGRWARTYTFRKESIPVEVTEDFEMIDDVGTRHNVVRVREVESGPRARKITILVERYGTA